MSADEREELRTSGLLHRPGALSPAEADQLEAAIDRVYAEERRRGSVEAGGRMHVLGGIGRDDGFLSLVDHPAVFPLIWGELGWNIHLYHCHLDVNPPRRSPRPSPIWRWHQHGGRQNLEVDGDPRPRFSLKVAYWLSDLSEADRGNMLVVPGSHRRNSLPRPAPGETFNDPDGASPVLARRGDALIFDRRLWHSRSDNLSQLTRKAIFLAYTYRWIRPRDDLGIGADDPRLGRLSPVRRQLLGGPATPMSHWGLGDEPVPLRVELDRRELLDAAVPSHR